LKNSGGHALSLRRERSGGTAMTVDKMFSE
jgi:hypothetical protein